MKIAIGKNKKTKTYENISIMWRNFIGEYFITPKISEDKDVGGFVGGYLRHGSRRREDVMSRSLLCLDLDYCETRDTLKNVLSILSILDCNYLVHSTYSYTDLNPRYRIIIPFSHEMSSENGEYEFVCEKIGVKFPGVDPVSYERNRMVYFPAVPDKGHPYVLHYVCDKKQLNPDRLMDNFEGDFVEVNKRYTKEWKHDPSLESGVIGAFCRTYPIETCIASFLSDVYEGPDERGRYTYIPGTSRGGLEIKDDGTLCQSYHGTDPASKRLGKPRQCNSFNLIMIHRYNDDDRMIDEVIKWCLKQPGVKEDKKFISEKSHPIWDKKHVKITKDGNKIPKISRSNLIALLEFKQVNLRYNELDDLVYIVTPSDPERVWCDEDAVYIRDLAQEYCMLGVSQNLILSYVKQISKLQAFNPIKRYLENLPPWDGVNRVDTLLSEYFDAEESEYTKHAIRKVLCGAVKRLYNPGCEFQYLLVLKGPQNIGKSHFWKTLAGEEYFSDDLSLTDMQQRAGTEKLQGNWFIEVPECSGMKKAEIESVKAFITRQVDKCRLAYGRSVSNIPRKSVLVGTINPQGYLKDVTGNRRFLTVEVTKRTGSNLNRDQIWAQILEIYKTEDLRLPYHVEKEAELIAQKNIETDDRMSLIDNYLEQEIPKNWYNSKISDRMAYFSDSKFSNSTYSKDMMKRERISLIEIWCECLQQDKGKFSRRESNQLLNNLICLGWVKKVQKRDTYGYGRPVSYMKNDPIATTDNI